MPKKPVSVTLEAANLLWLRGRAAGRKKRSLSDALDEILTEARRGGRGAATAQSVVGTIDLADADPALDQTDAAVRAIFDAALSRPVMVRESPEPPTRPAKAPPSRKLRRG